MRDLYKLAEIYRPYSTGTINALLHVRSAGHYVTGPGWSDGCVRKEFLELFWCVRGEGEFRRGETSWILKPGEVCFYFPVVFPADPRILQVLDVIANRQHYLACCQAFPDQV